MLARPLWSLVILILWLLFLAAAPAGTALGWSAPPSPESPLTAPALPDPSTLPALAGFDCQPPAQTQLPPNECEALMTPANQGPGAGLLALHALSLDTPEQSDLAWTYHPAITGLQQASAQSLSTTIVVLVDMPGYDNSFIYLFQAGEGTLIAGLPDANGTLTDTLREYDMTDGATLGGFLRWARTTYPTTGPTTFTYVGHGGPLIPETDYEQIFSTPTPGPVTSVSGTLPPLPVRVDANPEFTDITPARSFLSVYQLSEALRIGSDNGSNPFAVLDLIKCLSGSIEELYPLAPYATTITTSPSYSYFAPEMLGEGVAALDATDSPQDLARTLVATYESVIEGYDGADNVHPRLLLALDSAMLSEIKDSWHRVAHYLLESFDSTRLRAAYTNSAHYDTSYCLPQDWALQSPDAMVDLHTFATELSMRFPNSGVEIWALTVRKQVNAAILARHQENGVPWFGPDAPLWNFDRHRGIGLYVGIEPQTIEGEDYLTWQAHFYTSTVSTDNPHPYTFLNVNPGKGSWAEVLGRMWAEMPEMETAACLPDLPSPPQTGELSVQEIPIPFRGTVTDGSPTHIIAAVRTNHIVMNPSVAITVTLQDQTVFTETLRGRYAIPGTYPLALSHPWVPDLPDPKVSQPFTITVVVDPDNEIEEANEMDNHATLTDQVWTAPLHPRPILTARLLGEPQWVSSPSLVLNVEQHTSTLSAPVHTLRVHIYQYTSGNNPQILLPTYRTSLSFHDVDLTQPIPVTLPDTLAPALTVMIVWGWSAGGGSSWRPESTLLFNYTLPQQTITAGESHYFLFGANVGENLRFDLDVGAAQDANLFAWGPYNYGAPSHIAVNPGDDTLTIPIRFWDSYILAVYGVTTDTQYTLTVTPASVAAPHPLTATARPQGTDIPTQRPLFTAPIPRPPHQIFLPLVVR